MATFLPTLVTFWVGLYLMKMIPGNRAMYQAPGAPRQQPTEDYRTVSFEDLLNDSATVRVRAEGVDSFSHFVVDEHRQQIIVGARDHILRLGLRNLTILEKVPWFPDSLNVTICLAKGQTKEDCHNYIRVLILHSDGLFVCGTNAFSPLCSWRRLDRVSVVDSWIPGIARCPYSPHQNNTFLMTTDRNYYSATVTDFTARDAAIYRTIGPSKYLRTVRFNSHWLNEPDFISSYEIGEYIYFFFRETAIEYINCGKSVYPRVARICKSDSGGKILLEDNWTTFLKARLNCSLPGSYPFYFNDLQGTVYDETHQLIYAVFTTSPTSIYASAVCIYNISTIDLVFSGPYKHQSDAQMAWIRVPNSVPNVQCPGSTAKVSAAGNQSPLQRPLLDIQQHQMMDSAVQPLGLDPLVVMETERFSYVALDRINVTVHSRRREIPVLFLVTLEGIIHKMVVLPLGNTTTVCLVEKIHLSSSGSPGLVFSMKLQPKQKILYLSTRDSFYRIPVQRCFRFLSKEQCLAAQDPYCGWDDSIDKCTQSGHPGLSSCPTFNFPVDGAWSSWSPWSPCSHTGLASHIAVDQCKCRVRSCDQPKPAHTGRDCEGSSVEVNNCTVHGNWTQWSAWSACSDSCGLGVQIRQRSCTNPLPQHGGDACRGNDTEVNGCNRQECPTAPPFLPVHGGWSDWTEWTTCSAICGVGFHTRMRTCSRPVPKHGGRTCVSNSQEWKTCNTGDCDEIQKTSEWSPWLRVNASKDGGHQEERFRCICRAVVVDPLQLRTPSLKTSMKYCSANGDDCDAGSLKISDVDGGWSDWSAWTVCSALCGSGSQYRERLCNSPSPVGAGRECHGPSRELQACNTHSCVAQWTCWSEFSSCSVSCGTGGMRRRQRVCESELTTERHFVLPCEGDDVEVMPCERSPCKGSSGEWSGWTEWSACSEDSFQERRRHCRGQNRMLCVGGTTETRSCPSTHSVFHSNSVASRSQEFQTYHLLTASIFSFLVGIVLGAVSLHLFHRRRKRRKFTSIRKISEAEIKENDYTSGGDEPFPLPVGLADCHTYSSLKFSSMTTVKDASLKRKVLVQKSDSLKRNVLVQRSDSFMRTKLDQADGF